ncbi:MAG: GTP cyclohydrolase, FolE2/MptA family [Desulfovibrionaceae bacterium]
MIDIQSSIPLHSIPLQNVGISNYGVSFTYKGLQEYSIIALCDIGVSLDKTQRGTHMSRLAELLEENTLVLSTPWSLLPFLSQIKTKLQSSSAFITLHFQILLPLYSPTTKKLGHSLYQASFQATLHQNSFLPQMTLQIPYMTVCPCSLAISDTGAHSQRTLGNICLNSDSSFILEDCISLLHNTASSSVYPLVKRPDEKSLTETAFSHPYFVEDVARNMASSLQSHKSVFGYSIFIRSLESIHAHDAYATIEENCKKLHSLVEDTFPC